MTAPSDTDAERAFADVTAHLVPEPDVEQGKAFHAPGLKAGGKFFAMLVKEELVRGHAGRRTRRYTRPRMRGPHTTRRHR